MPYYITESNPDCAGWGVEKDDGTLLGCHTTKQAAIDQMVAVSVAEGIAPAGERAIGDPPAVIVDIDGTLITNDGRPRPAVINFIDEYDWAVFVVTARAESERDTTVAELDAFDLDYEQLFMKPNRDDDSVAYKRSVARELLRSWNVVAAVDNDEAMRRMYARLGIEAIDPNDVTSTDIEMPDDVDEDDPVSRAVQPPAYIRDAAQKGLDYYREGRGGDGLAEGTIREARRMAAGTMSDDKVIRANAWAARHEVDLEASQNRDPQDPDFPGAGAVAHYLWGIDPTDPGPARRWLTREAERIREEGRSMKTTVEMRAFDADAFELRAAESGDGMTFSGFAAKYDVPSLPLPFTERIAPGAFTRSLKSRNDVRMYVNHDESMVLASRRAGTLRLQDRAEGLYVEADLPPTTYGNDLSIMIKRGDVRTMSFGFSTVKDTWNDTGSERTLNEVRLHEVSVVTGTAAYPQTTAAVRNLRQIAARTSTDSEMLAEAIAALEAGDELTNDQAALLRTVVDRAAGIPAEPVQDPGLPLSVAQKQLDLAGKLIGV